MKGLLLVASAAVLWGCWALFLRPSGFESGASALMLFAAMSLPAPFIRWKTLRDAWPVLALLGVPDAANAVLYFAAVRNGPVSVGVLCHYLAPLIVALTASWVTDEPRSRRAMIAAPISLGGLALLLGPPGDGFPARTAMFGAGSAIFYAATVFLSKRAAKHCSAIEVTALHAPVSVLCVIVAFGRQVVPSASPRQWVFAIAGALLCGLVATLLFNAGLRRAPVQPASALTYLEPAIAAIVGSLCFGEPLGLRGVLGAMVMVAAGAWVVLEAPGRDNAVPMVRTNIAP